MHLQARNQRSTWFGLKVQRNWMKLRRNNLLDRSSLNHCHSSTQMTCLFLPFVSFREPIWLCHLTRTSSLHGDHKEILFIFSSPAFQVEYPSKSKKLPFLFKNQIVLPVKLIDASIFTWNQFSDFSTRLLLKMLSKS